MKILKKKSKLINKLNMKNFCTICDKSFSTKQNYEVHLKSKKHLNLCKNSTTSAPHQHHISTTYKKHIFECEFCSLIFKSQRSLTRHVKSCVKKHLIEKDLQLQKIKTELQKINEENINLKKENQKLKNDLQEKIIKSNDELKDITKLVLHNQKGNTNINSSYNIIINQFKDAPNLTLPKDLKINESLDKYIESGNPEGIVNF